MHGRHTHGSRHKRHLLAVFGLTSAFLVVEATVGLWTGSLALLADATHMLVDAGGVLLSLLAVWFAERPATPAKTYGYYRVEILAALVNGVVLCVMAVAIRSAIGLALITPDAIRANAITLRCSI